jgi:5'-nucleotidase / UDP-sugar diphosphatase
MVIKGVDMRRLILIFLMISPVLFAQNQIKLTLFSFKDSEEIFNLKNKKSTLASLMTTLEEERKKCTHSFTFLNGDFLSPRCLSAIDKGAHVVDFLNEMKVDLVSFGNHEFDFGTQELKKRIKEANFKWLSSNVIDLNEKPIEGCEEIFLLEVEGMKIGFFSLIDRKLVATAQDLYFLPILETARERCKELKQKGAEVIIALTHLSLEDNKKLAKEISDIHLIFGGHDKKSITYYVNDALVHNLGEKDFFLSRVDLIIKKEKGVVSNKTVVFPSVRLINVKSSDEHLTILKKIQSYHLKYKDLFENIATLKTDLDASIDLLRTKETAFGNLLADALKEALNAEVAIINSGVFCLNGSYPKDSVLQKKDLYQEFAYNDGLVLLEIKGNDLIEVLENALLLYDQKAPSFPLVSGMSFSFSPKENLKKIREVKINNVLIDPEKSYKLATTDYLSRGGDGFIAFKKAKLLSEEKISMVEALIKHVKNKKDLDSKVDGRMTLF